MTRLKPIVKEDFDLNKCDDWLVDRGASHHITNGRNWFATYTPFDQHKIMDSARQGVHIQAMGCWRIDVMVYNGSERCYT